MLAMNYRGPYRVRASHKAEPQIEHPNDAIVRVTRSSRATPWWCSAPDRLESLPQSLHGGWAPGA